MRLSDFILSNMEPILREWEAFARGIAPNSQMGSLALRDHAADILSATIRDMQSAQSATERTAKSRGVSRAGEGGGATLNGASELHAVDRLGSGFDLLELFAEYRALRASVLRLWSESKPRPDPRDLDDLTRFNESIDQSITKAVSSYTKKVDQSRDLFLAILSHDLRNPLNSIAMSAALLHTLDEPEAIGVATQITTNADVMARMISDLLDYTRTRLGAGMPVSPAAMDLGALCRALFNEFRTAHPERTIHFECRGDLTGHWDADRLRQAVSNLVGNALQHSPEGTPVRLVVHEEGLDVTAEVHNGGPPIPPGELSKIFNPLVRGASAEHPRQNRPGSIGLGLYIAREIARSHGGGIDVTSTPEGGTAFTLRVPRRHMPGVGAPILDEQHVQKM